MGSPRVTSAAGSRSAGIQGQWPRLALACASPAHNSGLAVRRHRLPACRRDPSLRSLRRLSASRTDETREEIASAKVVQPFTLMKRAAGDLHAEAVDGRLCRWNNELIYEISLLRRDGHIVRVLYNAANGKALERR